MEILTNIFISLFGGVIAGIYAGLVVARMAKFEEIRNQVKRVIWNIDFIYSEGEPQIIARKDISDILFSSSDFYSLKHKAAGDEVSTLLESVNSTIYSPPKDAEEMNERYSEWQLICRKLNPNLKVILSLRPWV